jgi:hypothetical protein
MNATEIVVREMQGNGGFQVRQLLAESVRQARQPAKLHSHGEVLPLHVASRNVACARVSDSHLGYRLRDPWWGVPPFVVLPKVSEQLHKLREVHIQPKDFRNGLGVEVEAIGGQLDLISKASVQIADETHGVCDAALSDAIGRDQFCVRIQRNENPLIAYFCAVLFANLALLLAHERPDFVALHIAAIEVAQLRIHQLFTSLANGFEQAHDGVAVEARQPFRGANRAAFKKALHRTRCRIGIGDHHGASQSFVGFAEGGITGSAAPSLDAPFTEKSESLAGLVLASYACHGLFSACAEREKPYNQLGSRVRLTPRSGLALPSAQTPDRAASCYSVTHGGLLTAGLLFGNRAEDFVLGVAPTNLGPFAVCTAKSFLSQFFLCPSNSRGFLALEFFEFFFGSPLIASTFVEGHGPDFAPISEAGKNLMDGCQWILLLQSYSSANQFISNRRRSPEAASVRFHYRCDSLRDTYVGINPTLAIFRERYKPSNGKLKRGDFSFNRPFLLVEGFQPCVGALKKGIVIKCHNERILSQ